MTTLGIAVIGQAPRPDIAAAFRDVAPEETRIVLRGCLDGMSRADVAAHPPRDRADALYTQLPSGEEARISKRAVVERAPATLAALRADGADALLFNCTGAFPPMAGDAGVVFPSRLLNGLATALVPQGRIGLFVPLEEQRGKLEAKWQRPGLDVVSVALSPSASDAAAVEAARALMQHRPDLLCFDCMSYREATRAAVRDVAGVPCLLAVTTVAAVLREMLL